MFHNSNNGAGSGGAGAQGELAATEAAKPSKIAKKKAKLKAKQEALRSVLVSNSKSTVSRSDLFS